MNRSQLWVKFRKKTNQLVQVQCDNEEIEAKVNQKIDALCQYLANVANPAVREPRENVTITFIEKRPTKGFFKSHEEVKWEQWIIPIRVVGPGDEGIVLCLFRLW
jgi:hypothetical protein